MYITRSLPEGQASPSGKITGNGSQVGRTGILERKGGISGYRPRGHMPARKSTNPIARVRATPSRQEAQAEAEQFFESNLL